MACLCQQPEASLCKQHSESEAGLARALKPGRLEQWGLSGAGSSIKYKCRDLNNQGSFFLQNKKSSSSGSTTKGPGVLRLFGPLPHFAVTAGEVMKGWVGRVLSGKQNFPRNAQWTWVSLARSKSVATRNSREAGKIGILLLCLQSRRQQTKNVLETTAGQTINHVCSRKLAL